jgi:hypothetical protein
MAEVHAIRTPIDRRLIDQNPVSDCRQEIYPLRTVEAWYQTPDQQRFFAMLLQPDMKQLIEQPAVLDN